MEPGFDALIAKFGVYGAIAVAALWGISKALPSIVQSFFSARTGATGAMAETSTIDMLSGQIASLSKTVAELSLAQQQARVDFDNERGKRLLAEFQVSRLSQRIATLEAQLVAKGITPEPNTP